MYHGTNVLDIHSHVHDRSQPRRLASPFWSALSGGHPGVSASKPLPSPIGPGKHSDQLGNRDEDFKIVADGVSRYIEERSIDTQILSPHPLEFHGWLEDDMHFESWIKYQNDKVFKLVQARPDRFIGAFQLPQRSKEKDTTHCLEELERCVNEYAFVAAYVSPDLDGKGSTPPMNQPYWYPLYEKCQDLNIPIIVHGTDAIDPRYRIMGVKRYYELNFLHSQGTAHVVLRENDQFERFPGLKVIICHCGSFIERLGPGRDFRVPNRDNSRNLFFDTAAYDMDFIASAIKQRGVSQFAFGSEAPGSGEELRPGTELTADDLVPMFESDPTLGFLTEEDKINILHNTPKMLFPGLEDSIAQNAQAKVKAY